VKFDQYVRVRAWSEQ